MTNQDRLDVLRQSKLAAELTEEQCCVLADLVALRDLKDGDVLVKEGESDDQAVERIKSSKYLTDFIHQEYAPFYDTEYKFGKLILRINNILRRGGPAATPKVEQLVFGPYTFQIAKRELKRGGEALKLAIWSDKDAIPNEQVELLGPLWVKYFGERNAEC